VYGGAIKYNESADVWSLGALIYAMVTADTSPTILATAAPQELAKQVNCRHDYTMTSHTTFACTRRSLAFVSCTSTIKFTA
jgi:hypothetical protein